MLRLCYDMKLGNTCNSKLQLEEGFKLIHVSYRLGNNGGERVITVMSSRQRGFERIVAVAFISCT